MIIAEYKEPLLSKRIIPAVKNTWEEPFYFTGEGALKKVSLVDIPLRQWRKAFQIEESGSTKAWGPRGEYLQVGGPRREEEAGKASWHPVADAFICLAMNFILSIN